MTGVSCAFVSSLLISTYSHMVNIRTTKVRTCCSARAMPLNPFPPTGLGRSLEGTGVLCAFPRKPNIKNQENSISVCEILKNKWYHAKVLPKRFYLNGHTIGFRSQTQKLELHYMSPELTLGGGEGLLNKHCLTHGQHTYSKGQNVRSCVALSFPAQRQTCKIL